MHSRRVHLDAKELLVGGRAGRGDWVIFKEYLVVEN